MRAAYITALAETHTLPTAAPPKHSAVFGLEPNRVPHGDPTSHTPRGGDQALVAALEARLQRRCDELLRFYDPSMSESAHGAHQVAAKAAQLATMVAAEREAAIAAAHRSAAAAVEVVAGPMATRNSRATASALDTLELIISRHKLDARRHYIETTTKFLKAKSTAIRLKLRALLLQVRTHVPSSRLVIIDFGISRAEWGYKRFLYTGGGEGGGWGHGVDPSSHVVSLTDHPTPSFSRLWHM